MGRLSRSDILNALDALAKELQSSGETTELFVVGGAALVLLYDARESTKDIDAITANPKMAADVRAAAAEVARKLDLPEDWLNDAAKGYLQGLAPGVVLLDLPGLRVRALAPEQLLAMKLSAWRDDVDIEDARLLLRHMPGQRDEVWLRIEPHVVPGRELKARYAFDDLWEADHEPR